MSNDQCPKNSQCPMTNWDLGIGHCLVIGPWSLLIEAPRLSPAPPPSPDPPPQHQTSPSSASHSATAPPANPPSLLFPAQNAPADRCWKCSYTPSNTNLSSCAHQRSPAPSPP